MHEIVDSDSGGNPESPAAAWGVDRQRRLYSMRVVLPKRTFVLPWTHFLYAEGTEDAVSALFSLHTVVIKGAGLDSLLSDLAGQVVTELRQPTRVETFERSSAVGQRVVSVEVLKIDDKA